MKPKATFYTTQYGDALYINGKKLINAKPHNPFSIQDVLDLLGYEIVEFEANSIFNNDIDRDFLDEMPEDLSDVVTNFDYMFEKQ